MIMTEHPQDPTGSIFTDSSSDAFTELVRLGSDVILHQMEVSRQYDRKSGHLLTLSGGVLVIAAAVAGTLPERTTTDATSIAGLHVGFVFVALVLSFLFSSIAFVKFAVAYVGGRQHEDKLVIGWQPKRLIDAAKRKASMDEIRFSTLVGMEIWYQGNQEVLDRNTRLRRKGLIYLALGGFCLAASLIYTVGVIPG